MCLRLRILLLFCHGQVYCIFLFQIKSLDLTSSCIGLICTPPGAGTNLCTDRMCAAPSLALAATVGCGPNLRC
uniref:Putative secreted protein n=1 Tax=Anopheles triannulatus TaxID=58253 RepID=A0A2M4B5C3_9DIPT